MGIIVWAGERHADWKNKHLKKAVKIARHSLADGYQIHSSEVTRLERKVIREFKDRYLDRSMAWVHRDLAKRQQYALALAARKGYEKAGSDIPVLTKYLEKIGLEDANPVTTVEDAIKIMDGFQARNASLEAAFSEAKVDLRDMEEDLQAARDDARKAHQDVWKANAEIASLKGQIQDGQYAAADTAQVRQFRGFSTTAIETV